MTRILFIVLCLLTAPALAQDQTPTVQWSATDAAGRTLAVPDANRPTVILFVMPGQSMSAEALTQLKAALGEGAAATQAIAVVSGRDAEAHVEQVRQNAQWTDPIVVDPEYAACELMGVRAWPTTVIVDEAGAQLGHVGGLPRSYQKDIEAYLDFAHDRIDAEQLKDRLNTHHLVTSTGNQAVLGHVQAARRMLEQGDADAARQQLDTALAMGPQEPSLFLMMAHLRVQLDEPAAALELLDHVEPGSIAPFQLNVVRGRALLMQQKWDEARRLLENSLQLNPSPAETHYLLGLVEQHDENWQAAADHFRAAFEATHDARLIGIATEEE